MRERIIAAMVESGIPQAKAETYWTAFVQDVCDGDEPTEKGLGRLKDSQIEGAMKPLAAAAIIDAIRGPQTEAPKGRRFKPEKAHGYTAAELAAFVAADPNGKTDGLRAEVDSPRRTGGKPFRLIVDGKLDEKATADRIQALADRKPVAAFVVLGGKEVTPVGWETEAETQDDEDPYQRGVALGQPGDVSERLGLSLTGISHETRQAIDCAVQHDLSDASVRELQATARAFVGKGVNDVLAENPVARRAWPTWQKRTLKLARPFAEPTASTTGTRGGFWPPGKKETGWLAGRRDGDAAPESDTPVLRDRGDAASTTVADIVSAVIACHIERDSLLSGIQRSFTAQLPKRDRVDAQLLSDFQICKDAHRLSDGSEPYRMMLETALLLAGARREAKVFRDALAALSVPPAAATPPLVYAITGKHRSWEDMQKHFAMVRNGLCRLESHESPPSGGNIRKWREQMLDDAAILLVLVSVATFADAEVWNAVNAARAAGKRVLPVLVGPCDLDGTPFATLAVAPRSRRLYSDDAGPEIATTLRQFIASLPGR